MEIQTATVLVLVFLLMPAMSVLVSFSIISASSLTIIMSLTPGSGMLVSTRKIVGGIDSFTLLAMSFFALVGLLMNNGGIIKRLINLAVLLLGKVPGSLAMTDIAGNTIFGSISGSGIAVATVIGGIILPLKGGQGHDKGFLTAVNMTTAPVGQLIPPMASFIVHSATSDGVSVVALLIAGWVPGLLWAALYMAVACVYGAKHGYVMRRDKMSAAVIIKTIWEAIPSPFLIVTTVGGILPGHLTPTEASSVTVVYAFLLSVSIYKGTQTKNIPRVLMDTAAMTTTIMLIIGASSVLSFVLPFTGLPQAISSLLLGISDNRTVILLITNITLLIVGTFMDTAPTLLIFAPVFLPIVRSLGMGPVQSGAMIVVSLSIGTITPPAENVLFMGCGVIRLQMEDVMKKLLPFFAAIVAASMSITFVLGSSMWPPDVLGSLK